MRNSIWLISYMLVLYGGFLWRKIREDNIVASVTLTGVNIARVKTGGSRKQRKDMQPTVSCVVFRFPSTSRVTITTTRGQPPAPCLAIQPRAVRYCSSSSAVSFRVKITTGSLILLLYLDTTLHHCSILNHRPRSIFLDDVLTNWALVLDDILHVLIYCALDWVLYL